MKKIVSSLLVTFLVASGAFAFTSPEMATAINGNKLFQSSYNVTVTNNGNYYFMVKVASTSKIYFQPVLWNLTAASVYTATLYEGILFSTNAGGTNLAINTWYDGATSDCKGLAVTRTGSYSTTWASTTNFAATNTGTALYTLYLTGTNTALTSFQLQAGKYYFLVLSNTVATTTNIVSAQLQFTR